MNLRNFIFSPFLSLYSRNFYRQAAAASLGSGVLYLFYLGFIFSSGLAANFAIQAVPVIDRSVAAVRDSMPPLTVTKEGVVTTAQQPAKVEVPGLGTVLIVDTTKDTISQDQMKDTLVYLTRTKLYAREQSASELRVVDIKPTEPKVLENWQDFHFDGAKAWQIYQQIRPFSYPLIFILAFLGFWIWKITAAFFYSLLALALNLFRKNRLSYEKLLNLSMFALTAVTLLQWLKMFFPGFPLPLGFWVSFIVTGAYLVFALLATDESREIQEPNL